MSDSAERMRKLRARKQRDLLTVRGARLTAPRSASPEDMDAQAARAFERDLDERVARALAYAAWRDKAFESGECAHPLVEVEIVYPA